MTYLFVALAAVVVLALLLWRLAYSDFLQRVWAWAKGAQQAPTEQLPPCVRHILAGADPPLFAGNRLTSSSDVPRRSIREERAEIYLRRVLAVTGATSVGSTYVLNVGDVQFQVRDRYVRRLPDLSGSKDAYEETCFYLVHKGMPKSEEIATALLQLSHNPSLFDRWALQNGVAFKPDGRIFEHAQ